MIGIWLKQFVEYRVILYCFMFLFVIYYFMYMNVLVNFVLLFLFKVEDDCIYVYLKIMIK